MVASVKYAFLKKGVYWTQQISLAMKNRSMNKTVPDLRVPSIHPREDNEIACTYSDTASSEDTLFSLNHRHVLQTAP